MEKIKIPPSPCSVCIIYSMCEEMCDDADSYLIKHDYVDLCIGKIVGRVLGWESQEPKRQSSKFSLGGREKLIIRREYL